MSKRRRYILAGLAAMLIVPMALASVWGWSVYAYVRPYERIQRGESEAQVLAIYGRPDRITGPPENIAWDSESSIRPNQGECVRVFWYIPPIAVEEYTIGFDASSRVVSKYRYSSP